MAMKSRGSESHKQRLRGLYGGLSPSQAVARRATVAKQKELSASFARQETLRVRHGRIMDRVHAPMLKAFGRDAEAVRAAASLKSLTRQMRRRPLARPVTPLHKPRIVADLGATVVPPYDFQEVLFSSTGTPLNGSSADKSTGQITSDIGTDYDQPSSATVTVGVGIFFHPPTDCPGTLSISATLSYNSEWATLCAYASGHSDGWVGLAVEQFDMAGFPTGVLVDEKIFLWASDAWWTSGGFQFGSSSAFPVSAQCTVDNQHLYHVWIRSGGSISAAGWSGRIGGSYAGSRIIGSVPSITWELV
ncbi:MAG TPA: hypothetical protein VJN67_22220 [Stellaceae bacterium]|nr:hypothetical protein [Stellaceae bacterium]